MTTKDQALSRAILRCAEDMCAAAQSAPKACGLDSIRTAVLTGDEIAALAREMEAVEDTVPNCRPIFRRDAALVENAGAVVLIGTLRHFRKLVPCGLCGFASCGAAAAAGGHCCFDDMDLGVAIGSAASVAADRRIDNRVLYTAGIAAMRAGLLGADAATIIAIPLSVHPRNQFFLR